MRGIACSLLFSPAAMHTSAVPIRRKMRAVHIALGMCGKLEHDDADNSARALNGRSEKGTPPGV